MVRYGPRWSTNSLKSWRKLGASAGPAMLVVEQHLSFVLGLADRFAVFKRGEVVDTGPVDGGSAARIDEGMRLYAEPSYLLIVGAAGRKYRRSSPALKFESNDCLWRKADMKREMHIS
jgi:energy-coupling factor transporter ATP-binding protein EcfA2